MFSFFKARTSYTTSRLTDSNKPCCYSKDSTAQAAETASTKIKHAWQDLVEAKKELTRELEYMCCIKPACNFCALAETKCSCSDTLESEGVCGECKGGWEAGAGAVAGVKATDVKVAAGTLKKMYENVRKQQREAAR